MAVEVAVIKCPNCGRDNAPNFNFCLDCGYDLKTWREAFPDGLPTVPPPPAPAMTDPTGMMPSNLPAAMTPQAVQAPLPPRPADVTTEPVAAAVSFPPMPPVDLPPPPANLPSTLTPGPQPLPAMPFPPLSQNTGAVAAASMPPPPMVMPAPPLPSMPPPPQQAPAPTPASAPPVAQAAVKGCLACGYENAPTVKFCGNCGKRLDNAAPVAAAEPAGQGRTMFMHAADMGAVVSEKICKLVTIDQTGREGMTFTIKSGETVCGRNNGIILFFDDPFVSPTHCKFSFVGGKLTVHDLKSLNGVYLRVKQERMLQDGELIRLGRQLFRFESLKSAAFQIKKAEGDDSRIWGSPASQAFGRIVQILDDGRTGEIRLLTGERVQVGREVGDVVIPTDGFISGRHCVFMLQNGAPVLADLGSSNGTYVRVRERAEVGHGDFVLVGNQMLRVEIV